jgi:hypothetical protein
MTGCKPTEEAPGWRGDSRLPPGVSHLPAVPTGKAAPDLRVHRSRYQIAISNISFINSIDISKKVLQSTAALVDEVIECEISAAISDDIRFYDEIQWSKTRSPRRVIHGKKI